MTVDSNFCKELKNVLNEEFTQSNPDAVWCSDITYLWTDEGFVYLIARSAPARRAYIIGVPERVYLTSIMDLYSRKRMAWVLSRTLESKWVVKGIEKAKQKRKINKPLILHTDRGVQYVSQEYLKAIEGITRSYSKKAYPWDNACIESFHALIKREWINRFKIYNTARIHSHCNYYSPDEYEEMYWDNMEIESVKVC